MKQKRDIITMDECGRIHFPSTTNNDIWMNTNELIELFGIQDFPRQFWLDAVG